LSAASSPLVFFRELPQFGNMMTKRLLLAATASLFVLSAPVFSGTAAAGSSSSGMNSDYAGILETRMQAIEEQITRLTAQVEQADYQARQAQTRLQRLEEDVNTRFRMIEQGGGASASPAPSSASPAGAVVDRPPATASAGTDERMLGQLTGGNGAPAAALPDDPNTAYDTAFSKVRDGDYEAAESAMRAFVTKWPRHELSSNASYWMAETFYVRGNYEQAAKAFADGYQKYPRGAKAEDTLLKLGLTLSALNRGPDACVIFDQLQADFPRLSSTSKRRVDEERTQLKCNAPVERTPNPQRSGSTPSGRSTLER
jgi:tol-pal system protein YbgF